MISWSAASVIDRESDRSTRWIKEAVHIRKEGPRSMNRDEGSYQLSHTYDRTVLGKMGVEALDFGFATPKRHFLARNHVV